MIVQNIDNKSVTKSVFELTLDLIGKNTSTDYSVAALNRIKKQLDNEFNFSKSINVRGNSVEVDDRINEVHEKEMVDFLKRFISLAGSGYIKALLAEKLDKDHINYLRGLGMRFN